MTEFLNSINQWFKERTTSPLYTTYIFSVVVWNWKFFYTLFLQDQAVLKVPKIEYIEQKFLSDPSLVHYILYFFLPPIFMTYFLIWWAPFINNWAHKVNLEFYFQRKRIFDQKKLDYENSRKNTLEKLAETKEEQIKSEKKIEKAMSKEELWGIEFNEFSSTPGYQEFAKVLKATYEGWSTMSIGATALAMADSRGLINIENGQITLTDKGKFFSKEFLKIYPSL